MKKSGAYLVRYALEQLGVKFTFGIPGVHNTEIYDELDKSSAIQPILATHECSAAFMADGLSRTSENVGTLVLVPAAGITHASSGIAEAYLDGIPMLIISGGIRRDTGKSFQLHQIDQKKLTQAFVKKYFLIERHEDIIPTFYQAYELAKAGVPGPVFVEVPVEIQSFQKEVGTLPAYQISQQKLEFDKDILIGVCELLQKSKKPGLYLGWGAKEASGEAIALAEYLGMPVATTLQGLSVFPGSHPLHTGMGFGHFSVPAAAKAFKDCDCLLAIGTRFSELATGSYGLEVPENLIHVDIDSGVFNRNYLAKINVCADGKDFLIKILEMVKERCRKRSFEILAEQIKKDKQNYSLEWEEHRGEGGVGPGLFFKKLRDMMAAEDFLVVDDGKHTFLATELFPVHESKCFISPTDFNAMGYCVPAAIGCKLSHPAQRVVGIVGDGGFLMTGMEVLSASTLGLGLVYFVFHDGELGQISEFQKIPLKRKTCTILGDIKIEGVALATGASYLDMNNNTEIEPVMMEAFSRADKGVPVVVNVKIDYSKKTRFTKGVIKTNLSRFPLSDKVRFFARALKRNILD